MTDDVRAHRRAGPNDGGASRVPIGEAVKASLKRFGTDHLYLYQMHRFDPATSVEETIRAHA
ncbi:aldo/keto reductase [Rhizobium sp. RU36D]|uniref:aldo/keto reductase n=1 Tax=Rhizobium sp. RU36D TaxID=1907415 RepID=UPI001179DDE0